MEAKAKAEEETMKKAETGIIPKGKKFFIRHINPKFIYFDKPFFLAIIVFVFTGAIFGVILWQLLIECKTREVTNTGDTNSQIKFIAAAYYSGAEICLQQSNLYTTFDTSSGMRVLRQSPCLVESWFLGSIPESYVKDVVPAKLLKDATKGVEWCDYAPIKTAAECEKITGKACPGCAEGGSAEAQTIFNSVYEETICPTPSVQIGVALSYAGHIETIMTLLIVFALMVCRVVHQIGPNGKEGLCDAVKAEAEAAAKQSVDTAATDAVNSAL